MASSEHKDLAAYIKSIHRNLREESHIYGPEEAWKRHLAERETLQKYAQFMHELATKHWAENVADPTKNTKCRIDWVKSQCLEYFFKGGNEMFWKRELNIKHKIMNNSSIDETTLNQVQMHDDVDLSRSGNESSIPRELMSEHMLQSTKYASNNEDLEKIRTVNEDQIRDNFLKKEHIKKRKDFDIDAWVADISESFPQITHSLEIGVSKVKLLDVGSCYNPFGCVDFFDVTPIDLAPSDDTVLQCDFLSLQVGSENIFSDNNKQVVQLTQGSFETVVFCLLLEYLPCPKQRYACCEKAYDLLKSGGILLIITPDSKHVGANAKFMKSWRYVLSNLGFMRIKYEKLPHVHCIAFRKCLYKEVAGRWCALQKISQLDELFRSENKMFIPQDFRENKTRDEAVEVTPLEKSTDVNNFNELPYT